MSSTYFGKGAGWIRVLLFCLILGPVARAEVTTPGPSVADDIMKLRDPFHAPDGIAAKADVVANDLERFSIGEFKLLGVITGPSRVRALVQCPNGKTYFVSEKMRIGNHKGIVRKILSDVIQVRERVPNALGQDESIDGEIRLSIGDSLGAQNSEGGR